jgi:hypothetical protein
VTLIISVLTEQYVALVSDRRTTWSVRGKITRQEDTDTKTFNLFGQFLMGFTGLARINGWRIERWAMEIFKDVRTEDYFNVLMREISATFDRRGISGEQAHAFLAVGYASLEPDGEIHPLCITISNSLDGNGCFSPEALTTQFQMQVERLGNRGQLIRSAGWTMRETTSEALAHRIRVVAKGDPGNPALSVGPLVMALRDTARVSADSVGSAVLFASLPRCAAPSLGMTAGEVDYRNQAVSLFVPEAAREASDGTVYMPAMINPRMMITGIKISRGVKPPRLGQQEGFQ